MLLRTELPERKKELQIAVNALDEAVDGND